MKRHYCRRCGRKSSEEKMVFASSPLLRFGAWVCRSHLSEHADILTLREEAIKPVFVELFSGSGHIAAAARCAGFEAITVDNNPDLEPDICIDVRNLRRSALPQNVDVVWCSFPCTDFSKLSLANKWEQQPIGYRRYYYQPRSPESVETLQLLHSTIRLLVKLSPVYYFIENPVGAMRHMPHVLFVPYRHTVAYSDYGFQYLKPTDIFTNCPYFHPRPFTMPAEMPAGKLVEQKGVFARSLVPPGLITEMLDSVRHLAAGRLDGGADTAHNRSK